MHTAQLLTAYDQQVRGSFSNRLPASWTASSDGPLTRCHTHQGGFVLAEDGLHAWTRAEIDQLVERTVEHYEDISFEWKTFSHDNPEIVASLLAHGFTPDDPETLILGDVQTLTGPELNTGGQPPVHLRVGTVDDLASVARIEEEVWNDSWDWFVPEMTARLSADDPTHLVLAEDKGTGQVVAAGWLVPMPGTVVAGLWGGSTLESYQGRGIYRAIVRARANEAARRDVEIRQVDASDDSRPILESLGLTAVGTTTPYRHN